MSHVWWRVLNAQNSCHQRHTAIYLAKSFQFLIVHCYQRHAVRQRLFFKFGLYYLKVRLKISMSNTLTPMSSKFEIDSLDLLSRGHLTSGSNVSRGTMTLGHPSWPENWVKCRLVTFRPGHNSCSHYFLLCIGC